jgi:HSP20 family protein
MPDETSQDNQKAESVRLNDFLAEVTGAARELSNSIRGSVSKAIKLSSTGDYPPLDIYETPDSVIVHSAPLDSAATAKVEVSMAGDKLTVKITTFPGTEIADEAYLHRERRYGEFVRTIQIPRSVKAQEAKARLKNGVLTITLPKVQDVGPKVIDVQMAD